MEMYSMPLREIRKRFTRSEVTIAAWRSQETYYKMKQRRSAPRESLQDGHFAIRRSDPNKIPFPDLSHMTGEEAGRVLERLGHNFGVIERNG